MLHITSNVLFVFLHMHMQHIIEPAETWVQMGKACETLQALFERNGHICLFCMKHYAEARFGARREQVELESFSSIKHQ